MRQLVHIFLLFLLAGTTARLPAQTRTAALDQALTLLGELVEAGNYEEAQVEAENLRDYLLQHQLPCPAEAVPLLSDIYRHNRDKKSAREFLDEAARSAQNHPDPQLLNALADAYFVWRRPEAALDCLRRLLVAKDSIAERERRDDIAALQQQLDSLARHQRAESMEQTGIVRLRQEHLLFAGGGLLALVLLLLLFRRRTATRWRKLLAKRDLEIEFLRSERFTNTLPVDMNMPQILEQAPAYHQDKTGHTGNHHRPDKTALIIEPNRQIVLYLKSLLSDRFEVETAVTATEGLLAASSHLPDLVVCAAVLNGQTGIEVVRQIKLAERTNHIPVILLTERFGNEGKLDALRAGADAWFTRPVLDRDLDAQVTLLLDAHKQGHERFARFLHLYFSENRIPLNDPFLAKVVAAIEQSLSDPDFMADDLARKMQLNKQHFFKKLFVLTGKEPVQLLREMRLEKARSLLEVRAGTPQTIAELVGFSSSGTFALAFKEYFGENTLLLKRPG
ncbi:MAG: helix-turn-helix domain-containing protein [Lewinellaceae bacterium]|nr:helix-turn-helix domain-containing protein [Lewinellaceae bacterium]